MIFTFFPDAVTLSQLIPKWYLTSPDIPCRDGAPANSLKISSFGFWPTIAENVQFPAMTAREDDIADAILGAGVDYCFNSG